jgi:5-methylthioadenosine/S-adenosylhomocysteine deaminase
MTLSQSIDLLITGGTVITQNAQREIINQGAVAVQGASIVAVGPADQLNAQYRALRTIDARGLFAFPGLINTHNHLFQTFIKGLGQGLSLYEWVDGIAAPSAVAMTAREAYLSAVLGGLEALRSGTTTMLDFMYSMPVSHLYREVGRAFRDLGLRGILGLGLMETGEQHDLSPCQFRPVSEALAEWASLAAELSTDLISPALAPEIAFGITRPGLEHIRRFASDQNMPITLHLNEADDDDRAMLADYGVRCIPFLEQIGFLGPDVLAVHCVKVQPEDIDIMARHNVKISHNPISNMYIGIGAAPIIKMVNAGLTVSLATDGAGANNSQDMLEVLKCAGLMHRLMALDAAATSAPMILDMATLGGAKAIGQADRLGSLEVGKQADLFLFDPLRPRAIPVLDPVSTLVFSSGTESITTTIVAGKVLLDNGKVITVDERDILTECQAAAWDLARRAGTDRFLAKDGYRYS